MNSPMSACARGSLLAQLLEVLDRRVLDLGVEERTPRLDLVAHDPPAELRAEEALELRRIDPLEGGEEKRPDLRRHRLRS